MTDILWQARDLGFAYPGQAALFEGLSFSLRTRDRILLRGANGCGKSTLLSLLMGILEPVTGSLELKGKKPSELSPAAWRDLVFCRQSAPANLFGLTPGHDLATWQLAFPERFSEQAVRELDDPLLQKLDSVYTSLSGGELRAFSLLWLPLLKDKFWLLDEPTAGLDASRKERFAQLCADKAETESSMLIVSHDPVLPQDLFDRVLLLELGKLRELK
ncbi:MAG: ATP-binding cassette domain-containing protein [Candidatus Syntrophosphaera sp.]|nr:ATP-binding cassette domain-containing protein [Candidatus Syntrophosphaera sp.]